MASTSANAELQRDGVVENTAYIIGRIFVDMILSSRKAHGKEKEKESIAVQVQFDESRTLRLFLVYSMEDLFELSRALKEETAALVKVGDNGLYFCDQNCAANPINVSGFLPKLDKFFTDEKSAKLELTESDVGLHFWVQLWRCISIGLATVSRRGINHFYQLPKWRCFFRLSPPCLTTTTNLLLDYWAQEQEKVKEVIGEVLDLFRRQFPTVTVDIPRYEVGAFIFEWSGLLSFLNKPIRNGKNNIELARCFVLQSKFDVFFMFASRKTMMDRTYSYREPGGMLSSIREDCFYSQELCGYAKRELYNQRCLDDVLNLYTDAFFAKLDAGLTGQEGYGYVEALEPPGQSSSEQESSQRRNEQEPKRTDLIGELEEVREQMQLCEGNAERLCQLKMQLKEVKSKLDAQDKKAREQDKEIQALQKKGRKCGADLDSLQHQKNELLRKLDEAKSDGRPEKLEEIRKTHEAKKGALEARLAGLRTENERLQRELVQLRTESEALIVAARSAKAELRTRGSVLMVQAQQREAMQQEFKLLQVEVGTLRSETLANSKLAPDCDMSKRREEARVTQSQTESDSKALDKELEKRRAELAMLKRELAGGETTVCDDGGEAHKSSSSQKLSDP